MQPMHDTQEHRTRAATAAHTVGCRAAMGSGHAGAAATRCFVTTRVCLACNTRVLWTSTPYPHSTPTLPAGAPALLPVVRGAMWQLAAGSAGPWVPVITAAAPPGSRVAAARGARWRGVAGGELSPAAAARRPPWPGGRRPGEGRARSLTPGSSASVCMRAGAPLMPGSGGSAAAGARAPAGLNSIAGAAEGATSPLTAGCRSPAAPGAGGAPFCPAALAALRSALTTFSSCTSTAAGNTQHSQRTPDWRAAARCCANTTRQGQVSLGQRPCTPLWQTLGCNACVGAAGGALLVAKGPSTPT